MRPHPTRSSPCSPRQTTSSSQARTGTRSAWAAPFEAAADDPEEIGAIEFQTGIHQLKVDASELAVAITSTAMRACGLSGYRNDGDASIGRLLRDVLSAPIMISNDRVLASLAAAAVLPEVPALLRD